MADARDTSPSPAERVITKDFRDNPGVGRPLSRAVRQSQRSVEGYLQSGERPRWMDRVAEIDRGEAAAVRELEAARRALAEETGEDTREFRRRWRELADGWSFGDHNTLVQQHNDWYPIERQLPVDPVTGEYVRIHGRSYRRRRLDAAWILERFPA